MRRKSLDRQWIRKRIGEERKRWKQTIEKWGKWYLRGSISG